jgi:8-oxo-dGTP diphosphatase
LRSNSTANCISNSAAAITYIAVFLAHDLRGELRETDEAIPLWTPLDAIPYHEMWADDRHWLPLLIRGAHFAGYFEFDGERLLRQKIVVRES